MLNSDTQNSHWVQVPLLMLHLRGRVHCTGSRSRMIASGYMTIGNRITGDQVIRSLTRAVWCFANCLFLLSQFLLPRSALRPRIIFLLSMLFQLSMLCIFSFTEAITTPRVVDMAVHCRVQKQFDQVFRLSKGSKCHGKTGSTTSVGMRE